MLQHLKLHPKTATASVRCIEHFVVTALHSITEQRQHVEIKIFIVNFIVKKICTCKADLQTSANTTQ